MLLGALDRHLILVRISQISIAELIETVSEITGLDVEVQTDQKRLRPAVSEVQRLFADASKAQDILRWTPSFDGKDGFREGLSKTIEWFRKSENLARYKVGRYSV